MACAGVVVMSATAASGWEAYVDGKSADVFSAYGSLLSVGVPSGRHRVEFRYRPWSVTAGVALTLVGFLLPFFAGLLDLRYKL
jgi:uncharacterized membrane protein YfhO